VLVADNFQPYGAHRNGRCGFLPWPLFLLAVSVSFLCRVAERATVKKGGCEGATWHFSFLARKFFFFTGGARGRRRTRRWAAPPRAPPTRPRTPPLQQPQTTRCHRRGGGTGIALEGRIQRRLLLRDAARPNGMVGSHAGAAGYEAGAVARYGGADVEAAHARADSSGAGGSVRQRSVRKRRRREGGVWRAIAVGGVTVWPTLARGAGGTRDGTRRRPAGSSATPF